MGLLSNEPHEGAAASPAVGPGCGGALLVPSGRDGVFWGEGLGQRSTLPTGHLSEDKIELWGFLVVLWLLFPSMMGNLEN